MLGAWCLVLGAEKWSNAMSELYKLGIEEAAKGLTKGEFTSVELTQAVIDRVKAEVCERTVRIQDELAQG